ncbi:hypothetical protein GPECTOR_145g746 [Gonium pectorale]|uniref:BTB domain-containing protein n=1 Tax=Gonium pectorale TaxID=33097 RepID=A0A150FZ20_GONPE|nr:hypothetical protein GPECTOR_145g746 [Gonium pectorale]|eukprot:KXZ42455.1 hypothetical protein GPECTOR_145g746 [Gonium pectorale]
MLAPPLLLTGDAAVYMKSACDATHDPHSDSVIVALPRALLAISAAGEVSVVVGDPVDPVDSRERSRVDGPSRDASFGYIVRVAAGRSGMLYALDQTMGRVAVRQVQRCGGSCFVTTIYDSFPAGSMEDPTALVYNHHRDELLLGTEICPYDHSHRSLALERLVPPAGWSVVAGGPHNRRTGEPVAGPSAHFELLRDIAADEAGDVYILDGDSVRVLAAADGSISYLQDGGLWSYRKNDENGPDAFGLTLGLEGSLAALPGGLVAIWVRGDDTVQLLQLRQDGEQPGGDATAAGSAAAAAAGGGRKRPHSSLLAGLSADMGALLDGRLGGDGGGADVAPPDVTILAGSGGGEGSGGEDGGGEARRSFPAHRAILAARCPYFRRLFAGGFADSAAPRVELPDAEPEALAPVLRHLYTGDPGDLTEGLLRPVAELADRLLLPELRDHVAARLVRSVTPGTVVDGMLWADRAGAGMEGLLRRLVAYFTKHRAEMVAQALGSLEELTSRGSPSLLKLLLLQGVQMP